MCRLLRSSKEGNVEKKEEEVVSLSSRRLLPPALLRPLVASEGRDSTHQEIIEQPLLPKGPNVGSEDADVVRSEVSRLVDGAEEILDLKRIEMEGSVGGLRWVTPFRRNPRVGRIPSD